MGLSILMFNINLVRGWELCPQTPAPISDYIPHLETTLEKFWICPCCLNGRGFIGKYFVFNFVVHMNSIVIVLLLNFYLQQTCRQLEAIHGMFSTMSPQKLGIVGVVMLIM